jgi:hypothetical protein
MAPPDKDTERYFLHYLLPARNRVTGRSLVYLYSHERPDFVCARGNQVPVGVEVTQITFGPHDRISDEQAIEQVHRLIEKKEASRVKPGWTYPERAILVIATQERSIEEMIWLLPNEVRRDFAEHGFKEVWLADYTLEDAHGDIELFGLYPRQFWGYHKRLETGRKPYG